MAINIECILSQLIAAREPSKRVTKKKKTKCYHSTEAIVTCLAFFFVLSNNESNFLFQKKYDIECGGETERVQSDITMHQLTYTHMGNATNTHTHA